MKAGTTFIAVIAVLASSSVQGKTYRCTLDDPQAIFESEGKVAGSAISFGELSEEPWTFDLVTSDRNTTIDWPESPIQLDGESPRIQTGPSSFASFHVGRGPCMFTEGHCGSLVHFSEQSDGNISLLVQPIGLTMNSDEERAPFIVYLPGNCSMEEAN